MLDVAPHPLFRYDLPLEDDPIRRLLDKRVPWLIHGEAFSQQSFGAGPQLEQGWKVHVSATPLSAADVLQRALDVLLAEGVRFKVVGSVALLARFNAGLFGTPQIGKFLTAYPSDDAQAVRIAIALHGATAGLRGPRVPTDRPLRPDSLVHYRYGAMVQRPESEALGPGEHGRYGLLDPAGRLTDDLRLPYYLPPPAEISDPFDIAGAYVPRPESPSLLNARYLVNDVLSRSPRGGVFRAVDVGAQPARVCLLKEAWHDVCLDQYGRDANDWAANEARILSRHAGDLALPEYYETFEMNGDRYLALEYIPGTPLDRVLEGGHTLKDGLPGAELAEIGLVTAAALSHLHDIGIVFRDFKPGNIVRVPDGGYRLIDFGIAYEYRDNNGPGLGLGTPPFCSPAQYDGQPPTPADDIFSWGAVLYALACGEAAWEQMPKGAERFRPFARSPVLDFRPSLSPALAGVIERAAAWEASERYSTMREAHAALAAAAETATRPSRRRGGRVGGGSTAPDSLPQDPAQLAPADALTLARDIGDALCDEAEERLGGLCWAARSEVSAQTSYQPDLYAGAAGIALFLAELAHATGEQRYADAARGAARWLAGPAWGRGRAQHGLHCGEGGIAVFFLRLAKLLDEPGYVQAAELRLRRLLGAASGTVDLIYGTAGTLMALASLYLETGEPGYLAHARALGDDLIAAALPAPNGPGCLWNVQTPSAGGVGQPILGLMHGAAGIAMALAYLAAASGEERYLDAAKSAAVMLLNQAVHGASGWAWPRILGDADPGLQAYCHGAGGISQFFFSLNRVAPDDRYLAAGERGARTIASQRHAEQRLGFCHGLSGCGQLLLDAHQELGDESYASWASQCGADLGRFRRTVTNGDRGTRGADENKNVYTMRVGGATSPDLMLGYAGAGSLLLRLAQADRAREPILGRLWEQVAPRKGDHDV